MPFIYHMMGMIHGLIIAPKQEETQIPQRVKRGRSIVVDRGTAHHNHDHPSIGRPGLDPVFFPFFFFFFFFFFGVTPDCQLSSFVQSGVSAALRELNLLHLSREPSWVEGKVEPVTNYLLDRNRALLLSPTLIGRKGAIG